MQCRRVVLHFLAAAMVWNIAFFMLSATRARCVVPSTGVAIGVLRAYGSAQEEHKGRHGTYATAKQLHDEGLIPDEFFNDEAYGRYSFRSWVANGGATFVIVAEPLDALRWYSLNPDFWFLYLDSSGEIRRSWAHPAGLSSPILGAVTALLVRVAAGPN